MTKIVRLDIENVKKIKAVSIEPTQNGITLIGGRNGQGKTSVLDSIAWALGGDKYRPSQPVREGSAIPPHLRIELTNGLVVERRGKNSDLKVTDPSGNIGGQQLLNKFISSFALDLPKFMNASGREKADTLLKIIGVGDKVYELEAEESRLYDQRHFIGRQADQKRKYAAEMMSYDGVPDDLVSPSALIRQQQEILAKNGENQRKRDNAERLRIEVERTAAEVKRLNDEYQKAAARLDSLKSDLAAAEKSAEQLTDESTAELEKSIAEIDEINSKIRVNLEKQRAEDEAKEYFRQYEQLTSQLDDIRKEKYDLLNSAELPLPGLSVENRELTYNGFKWDNMSSSEQLKAAAAIVRRINPECGFVLMDKLEQMDAQTLAEFGAWLESEGLQAIATRVGTGDECSIIIEDGCNINQEKTAWKAGTF